MKSPALVVRNWDGHPIQRRCADGYVNATNMCQTVGKRWRDYAITYRTIDYVRALSGSTGIPADLLVQSKTTGPNDSRGTWVHPRLAVDLARWISPELAVWMDGWILEEALGEAQQALQSEKHPARQPRLKPAEEADLTDEDVCAVIGLACASIGSRLSRYASLLGHPGFVTVQTLDQAHACITDARDLFAMVERIAPRIKPTTTTTNP